MVSTLVVGTNTYVTRVEANTYLEDSFAWAANWTALTDDQKDQTLLSAFRLLEKQLWSGVSVGGTPFFPATGVTDCAGTALSDSAVPQDIKDAQIELAYALSQDANLEGATSTADNTKKLQAGSASIEFFNTDGSPDFANTRFPANVMELVRCYLSAYGVSSGAEAIGATGESLFDDECDDYDRNLPF